METTYERLTRERLQTLYGVRGATTPTATATVAKEHKIEITKPHGRSTGFTVKETHG